MTNRGRAAEDAALAFVQARGLKLVERNYRCRYGEIDLILRDNATLVFAEVRLRTRQDYGGAAESVTLIKQRRLIAAAQHYLAGKDPPPCRFDVLLLSTVDDADMQWLKDAFSA